MKTLKFALIATIVACVLINLAYADGYKTKMELPEEEYVDDIPLNTGQIALKALLDRIMLENEEPSVDDIPFDTEKIYNDFQMTQLKAQWQEESYVDDIPFNTEKIYNDFQMTELKAQWQGESNVDYIPFKNYFLSLFQNMIMNVMPGYLDFKYIFLILICCTYYINVKGFPD